MGKPWWDESFLPVKPVRVFLNWHDAWIGVYWGHRAIEGETIQFVYICLIPCLPIRFQRKARDQ